ncbi:MAG: hypothetical protein MUF06_12980, partial [Pirellulaceae bacterium]|nr:hypothetical protein [Pirellulaceae bacterium]
RIQGIGRPAVSSLAEFVYRVLMKKDPWIRVGEFHFWDPLAAALLTDESQASYQELSLKVIEEEGPTSGHTLVSAEGQPVRVAVKSAVRPGLNPMEMAVSSPSERALYAPPHRRIITQPRKRVLFRRGSVSGSF